MESESRLELVKHLRDVLVTVRRDRDALRTGLKVLDAPEVQTVPAAERLQRKLTLRQGARSRCAEIVRDARQRAASSRRGDSDVDGLVRAIEAAWAEVFDGTIDQVETVQYVAAYGREAYLNRRVRLQQQEQIRVAKAVETILAETIRGAR